MKKINNVQFEHGNPALEITGYVDVLLIALNTPAPGAMFNPKQNFERTELYRKLVTAKEKAVKDQKPLEVEDADFKEIMAAYNVSGYEGRNDEAADMYAYMITIK